MTSDFNTLPGFSADCIGDQLPLLLHVQQVNQRHHEHPDHVYEVPVENHDVDVVSVVTAATVTQANHDHGHHAAYHVRKVQSGNAEKCSAKSSCSPGILKEAHASAISPSQSRRCNSAKRMPAAAVMK